MPPQPGIEGVARPPGAQGIEGAIEAHGLEGRLRFELLNEMAMPMESSFEGAPGSGGEGRGLLRLLLCCPHALHDAAQGQAPPGQMMGKARATTHCLGWGRHASVIVRPRLLEKRGQARLGGAFPRD